MPPSDLTRAELEVMHRDIVDDLEDLRQTLVWVEEQIKALPPEVDGRKPYTRGDQAKIRDWMRRQHRPVYIKEVAEALNISVGQAKYRLDDLYEKGTLGRGRQGRVLFYWYEKPGAKKSPLRAPLPPRSKPKLSGGEVPYSGKRNKMAMRERGVLGPDFKKIMKKRKEI
jgi:hypothetical protein